MKWRKAGAIGCTVLLAGMMGVGGVIDLLRTPEVREVIARLGYPPWFPLFLGVAKLLGVAALILPVPRVLREWAYAGFTFNLVAAGISHLAAGDPIQELVPPLSGLALLAGSYFLRRSAPTAPERAVSP